MAFSWTTFDKVVEHVLGELKPRSILDIGAGEGKYGKLVRAMGAPVKLVAVECDGTLHEGLYAAGYDEVRAITAQQLMDHPAETYDFVIMGDVIEHMKHSDGQDLLEFLNYRSAYILVITPECMPMSTARFYEGHNSVWPPHAMQWHDWWAHARCQVMHFYLLRGYLDWQAVGLDDLVNSANAAGLQLQPLDETTPVQCKLTLHDSRILEPVAQPAGHLKYFRPV